MDPFTIVVAVDKQHLKELKVVYPDWIEYKKEFRTYPWLIIRDSSVNEDELDFLKRDNVKIVEWTDGNLYQSQRESMLTALTILPCLYVDTPWFLKIDTDAFALSDTEWIPKLDPSVFCYSSPWGYSKPNNVVEFLDTWADARKLEGIPLNLPYIKEDDVVKCNRFISWLYFGNTKMHKDIVKLFKIKSGKWMLPVPSQDTTLWYLAQRYGYKWEKVNFKKLGWTHKKVKIR